MLDCNSGCWEPKKPCDILDPSARIFEMESVKYTIAELAFQKAKGCVAVFIDKQNETT